MYEICEHCQMYRESGDLESALNCKFCSGNGIVRSGSSYVCNKCGGPMCPSPSSPNRLVPYGLVEEKVTGGYDSFHLLDLNTYKFSLCEECLRQLFDSFTFYPDVYYQGDKIEYSEDRKQYEDRVWRKSGGHIAKMFTGKCNTVKDCDSLAVWRVSYGPRNLSADTCCEEHKQVYDSCVSAILTPYQHWDQEQYESLKLINLVMSQ